MQKEQLLVELHPISTDMEQVICAFEKKIWIVHKARIFPCTNIYHTIVETGRIHPSKKFDFFFPRGPHHVLHMYRLFIWYGFGLREGGGG